MSFDSFLDAEKLASFDMAKVYVRYKMAGEWEAWTQVWSKASLATADYGQWSHIADVSLGTAPTGATHVQLKFEFDTSDYLYNNYLGWQVDNITIPQAGTPTPPDNLPEKIEVLTAAPGDGQVTLNWTNPSNVPLTDVTLTRMAKPDGTDCVDAFPNGHTDGTAVTCDEGAIPTTGGTAVTCTDSGVTNDTTYCYAVFTSSEAGWNDQVNPGNVEQATPTETPPGWCEDWESGALGDWNAEGLWHVVSEDQKEQACGPDCPALAGFSGDYDVWYGQDETCNFDTGAANSGTLTSPAISVKPGTTYDLTFDSFLNVEKLIGFDKAEVYYSFDEGATWTSIWQKGDATQPATYDAWQTITKQITATSESMLLKFEFDTTDYLYNNSLGWEMDNIYINPVGAASLSGATVELTVSEVLNLPNPVKNTNATTFKAQGQGISSIKVQIYNLAGRHIFDSGYVEGNNVIWHLTTDDRAIVANGVYLYIVTVKGYDGKVIRSEVRKLVVLR